MGLIPWSPSPSMTITTTWGQILPSGTPEPDPTWMWMKQWMKIMMLLAFLFASTVVFSQTTLVTGTVTSAEDGMTIPGVSVVIKGSRWQHDIPTVSAQQHCIWSKSGLCSNHRYKRENRICESKFFKADRLFTERSKRQKNQCTQNKFNAHWNIQRFVGNDHDGPYMAWRVY